MLLGECSEPLVFPSDVVEVNAASLINHRVTLTHSSLPLAERDVPFAESLGWRTDPQIPEFVVVITGAFKSTIEFLKFTLQFSPSLLK